MASPSSECPSLPIDLVEEILCRVPIQSLTRFKLVSKQWLALFRDKRFIYKHLAFVKEQQFIRIRYLVQIINHENEPCKFIPLPLFFQGRLDISIRAHCDGLLLCGFGSGRLAIWNPYLKQVRWISNSMNPISFEYFCGIGYKFRDDGYKILRFYYGCHVDEGGNYKPEAEIYDFKYNSWRNLDSYRGWYVFKPYRGVSLNGNLYWIAKGNHKSQIFIQSFDFSVEKFEPLCFLPSTYGEPDFLALSDFRGDKLSLLHQRKETIDIWVTSKIKNGVFILWTKLFSVPRPNLSVLDATSNLVRDHPVYFIDNNNRIVVCCEELLEDGKCVCVNVYVIGEDGFEKPIEIQKHQNLGGIHWPFISGYAHLPSLVPVPN